MLLGFARALAELTCANRPDRLLHLRLQGLQLRELLQVAQVVAVVLGIETRLPRRKILLLDLDAVLAIGDLTAAAGDPLIQILAHAAQQTRGRGQAGLAEHFVERGRIGLQAFSRRDLSSDNWPLRSAFTPSSVRLTPSYFERSRLLSLLPIARMPASDANTAAVEFSPPALVSESSAVRSVLYALMKLSTLLAVPDVSSLTVKVSGDSLAVIARVNVRLTPSMLVKVFDACCMRTPP